MLHDVTVVFKNRGNAIVKSSEDGRGVYIYGSAWDLELGRNYDLSVQGLKTYRGLKELMKVYVKEKKEKVDIEKFYHVGPFRQNEIVRDIFGKYSNGYLSTKYGKIKVYFKNRKIKIENHKKIHIHFAIIGYFDELQLVVYNNKDFTIKD